MNTPLYESSENNRLDFHLASQKQTRDSISFSQFFVAGVAGNTSKLCLQGHSSGALDELKSKS